MKSLLPTDLKTQWMAAERIEVGRFYPFSGHDQQDFVVFIHASPLVALVEAAGMGGRVYEFMSITRPGDLLHYLWVIPGSASAEVAQRVDHRSPQIDANRPKPSKQGLPFTKFDECFAFEGDDTEPSSMVWIDFRRGEGFRGRLIRLMTKVEQLQQQLREHDDFLIRYELDLMESKCHRRAFDAEVPRWAMRSNPYSDETGLPADLYRVICELITQEDVMSVSCPLDDYALWRALVTEQIQRSIRSGLSPQEAFTLSGPDSGLPMIPYLEWGGDVHIPYEGMCSGDLLIPPGWRKLDASRGMGPEGRLSRVVGGKDCRYLLTDRDLGELECADRTAVGQWVLYRAKQAYAPCDPLGVRQAFNSTRYH